MVKSKNLIEKEIYDAFINLDKGYQFNNVEVDLIYENKEVVEVNVLLERLNWWGDGSTSKVNLCYVLSDDNIVTTVVNEDVVYRGKCEKQETPLFIYCFLNYENMKNIIKNCLCNNGYIVKKNSNL